MYRMYLPIKVIIMSVAIVSLVCTPLYAEFGYKDVYLYDEKTEGWVLLEPLDDTAYMIVDYIGAGGDSSGSLSVRGTLDILTSPVQSKGSRTFGILGESESLSYSNGPLTIAVTPLTDNIAVDNGEDWFVLPGTGNYAEWQFVYTVTNLGDVEMKDIEVSDNFGGELDVKDSDGAWLATPSRGGVAISHSGAMKKFKFKWDNFVLAPGESASLTIDLKLGKNPAGHQEYTTCGEVYDLNSGGVLKFRWKGQQGKGWASYEGEAFKVWVPCSPPSFCVSLSATGTEWYIRKPGHYYTKMLEGEVSATGNATIAVTFSKFDNLRSVGSSQVIPVFYALKDGEPSDSDWITPQYLNENLSLELKVSATTTSSWGMWQRVNLDTQSPGMYSNVGVITFTLVNSQPTYVGE